MAAFNVAYIAIVWSFNSDFLSRDNFRVIIENMALESIVMAVMVMLLAAGRFDLSVDGIAAVSAIVAGKLMIDVGAPSLAATCAGLGLGLAIGLLNGTLIEVLGLNPLITTLGTWWLASGAALGITAGVSPFGFPDSFLTLGQTRPADVLILVWYALVALPILAIVLRFTKFGYHVLATGGEREAARLSRVKVRRIGLVLYAASGLAAAFAGVMFAARLGSTTPTLMDGMALNVIAAAIIGGASLTGGRGSVVGGLLGLFVLNLVVSGSFYLGISPFWQKAIAGLILLAAIGGDAFSGIAQRRAELAGLSGGWGAAARAWLRSIPWLRASPARDGMWRDPPST